MLSSPKKYLTLALIVGVLGLFWVLNQAKTPILVSNARAVLNDGNMASVYLDLKNTEGPDVLTRVSSSLAEKAFITGVDRSYGLPIPATSTPGFSSDGAHIMLAMKKPISHGSFIPLTLDFSKAGAINIKAIVEAAQGAQTMSANNDMSKMKHSMGGMKHGDMSEMNQPMDAMNHDMPLNVENGQVPPSITLTVTSEADDNWRVSAVTENFEFAEPKDPVTHIYGQGHGHLYLNNLKLQRMHNNGAIIGALPSGKHTVSITLNTNDHRPYAIEGIPVSAQFDINVD